MIVTGSSASSAITIHLDEHGQFYCCWCGFQHRGEHALDDWLQHHCTHREPLIKLNDPDTGQLLCGQCGMIFSVEEAKKKE